MPGMLSEQSQGFTASSGSRKRKRDTLRIDVPQPIDNIRMIPSHLHNFENSLQLDYTSSWTHINECSSRPQNLPRKRRAVQQQCFHPAEQSKQSAFAHPNTASIKHLPSQTRSFPINRGSVSPPLSPRNQISKVSHQSSCTSPLILRPCHICHRRPTTKELLEAYADCDLCDQRACYICLRQCDAIDCCGPGKEHHGQGMWSDSTESLTTGTDRGQLSVRRPRMVCSCCAVEGITETGIEVVRCLACVR
ncbi:hypothetical protein BJX70DRAFT_353641 [Aspergillus crustosus]